MYKRSAERLSGLPALSLFNSVPTWVKMSQASPVSSAGVVGCDHGFMASAPQLGAEAGCGIDRVA